MNNSIEIVARLTGLNKTLEKLVNNCDEAGVALNQSVDIMELAIMDFDEDTYNFLRLVRDGELDKYLR